MAVLNYTGDGSGLMYHLGQIVRASNLLGDDALGMNDDLEAVLYAYNLGGQQDDLGSIIDQYSSAQNSLFGLRSNLASVAQSRLLDPVTMLQPLSIQNSNIQTLIASLISQMVIDAATIKGNICTAGSVTAAAANIGNGLVLNSIVLDGYQTPKTGMNAHIAYNGVNSQVTVNETMKLTCTADSYTDGRTAGQESFSWTGGVPNTNVWATGQGGYVLTEGSGIGPTVSTLNAQNYVLNSNFETFTVTNVPDNWTVVGTAGTDVFKETSNVYRGLASVKIIGDGATATVGITQALTVSQLKPRQRYCLAFWYKSVSNDTSSQSFTVQFTGTGYSAASSEKFTVLGNAYAAGWTLASFFINLPANLPSNWTLSIEITGTPNSGKGVYVDSLAFGPVQYFGGVSAVVLAGSTNFVRGDIFSFPVTNDNSGLFSDFFRKGFTCQLPAVVNGSGAETIPDDLAQ